MTAYVEQMPRELLQRVLDDLQPGQVAAAVLHYGAGRVTVTGPVHLDEKERKRIGDTPLAYPSGSPRTLLVSLIVLPDCASCGGYPEAGTCHCPPLEMSPPAAERILAEALTLVRRHQPVDVDQVHDHVGEVTP